MSDDLKRYEGNYIMYKHSHDGKAVFEISLYRKNRKGNGESIHVEMEIGRSSIRCIHQAIKKFADKEREQLGEMPL